MSFPRRILIALPLLVFAALITAFLSQGMSLSTDIFRSIAGWNAFALGYRLSDASLLALVATWAVTALVLFIRRRAITLSVLALGGLGAVIAYVCNKVLKDLFANMRPCNVYDYAVASCPPAENWSYPSNHTVIAVALATSLIVAVHRLAWLAVPLTLVTAFTRIVAGHHFPHDVVAGAVVGAVIVLVVVILLKPLAEALVLTTWEKLPLEAPTDRAPHRAPRH